MILSFVPITLEDAANVVFQGPRQQPVTSFRMCVCVYIYIYIHLSDGESYNQEAFTKFQSCKKSEETS
jgi:hypothetical protein